MCDLAAGKIENHVLQNFDNEACACREEGKKFHFHESMHISVRIYVHMWRICTQVQWAADTQESAGKEGGAWKILHMNERKWDKEYVTCCAAHSVHCEISCLMASLQARWQISFKSAPENPSVLSAISWKDTSGARGDLRKHDSKILMRDARSGTGMYTNCGNKVMISKWYTPGTSRSLVLVLSCACIVWGEMEMITMSIYIYIYI